MQNIHGKIKSEYERRQKSALDKLEARKAEIYSKIPRLYEVDSHIRHTGIKHNRLILQAVDQAGAILDSLLDEIDSLRREKAELLADFGYPADYLEMTFECPQCKDSGFIQGKDGSEKCSCYKQQLINILYRESNLQLSRNENFSSFDPNLFPDITDESRYGIKTSPRENILGIRERCLQFIDRIDSPAEKNLFFSGPAGVGKTFMSNCIALEVMNKGYTVLYQTAPVLFNTINQFRMKSSRDDEFEDMSYRSIFDVDLLIVDDLGTEPPSAARYAELLNILNTRHSNNLSRPCKLIISSNLGIKNLYEYYTERVASRVVGNFDMYRFAGEDIRTVKKLTGR